MSRTSASKGREILKSKEKFPEFNLIDYDVSLRSNLFYYSTEVDDNKKKKQWTLDYWKNTNKDISIVSKVPDSYFTTAGAVAHMLFVRELPLEIKDSSYLEKKYIWDSAKWQPVCRYSGCKSPPVIKGLCSRHHNALVINNVVGEKIIRASRSYKWNGKEYKMLC